MTLVNDRKLKLQNVIKTMSWYILILSKSAIGVMAGKGVGEDFGRQGYLLFADSWETKIS